MRGDLFTSRKVLWRAGLGCVWCHTMMFDGNPNDHWRRRWRCRLQRTRRTAHVIVSRHFCFDAARNRKDPLGGTIPTSTSSDRVGSSKGPCNDRKLECFALYKSQIYTLYVTQAHLHRRTQPKKRIPWRVKVNFFFQSLLRKSWWGSNGDRIAFADTGITLWWQY